MQEQQVVYLQDYKKPVYLIKEVYLNFDLFDDFTLVKSEMKMNLNEGYNLDEPLVLNGENLELISILINDDEVTENDYKISDDKLLISNLKEREFTLKIINKIKPDENKSCEGLYQSDAIFCTQNEPEGFRKITYFVDRPDVMAAYTTRITADKNKYPVLLCNGDLQEKGDLSNGRHFVVWKDPFLKPSYLFALVAGDLLCQKDEFVTMSGRQISLQFFVDKGNDGRCQFALDSLKRAMKWDEERFGLEYDLNIYMIVAVNAFNMGAMENKGLNIFNSSCVLADSKMATDQNFQNIEGIIAHEYFHNWTGNRVTCRDWFQLTLKEGLTVYRDQIFSEDMRMAVIKRIEEVNFLRNTQFVEDNGPMSHPIKPSSYMKINNFYTSTVYRKGAEVIRMIATLIGMQKFRQGIDKYFELFDGQAVTTEDFIYAMKLASGQDFEQFKRWYNQSGTPEIIISSYYDESKKIFELTIEQKLANKDDLPYLLPFALNLINKDGEDLLTDEVQVISEAKQTLSFSDIDSLPIPSLLRGFSAPIKLHYEYSIDELIFLFKYDSDDFNRYEAGQKLAHLVLVDLLKDSEAVIDKKILMIYGEILLDDKLDNDYKSKLLQIPSVTELTETMQVLDYVKAYQACQGLMKQIVQANYNNFQKIFKVNQQFLRQKKYSLDAQDIGCRSLKNSCLSYLYLADKSFSKVIFEEFTFAMSDEPSANMTDAFTSLKILSENHNDYRSQALEIFAKKWRNDAVVMNKWFAVQALSKSDNLLDEVRMLEKKSYFDNKNPNNIRSLYGCFAINGVIFHNDNGEGYQFFIDKIIELDKINPHIASGLATLLKNYRKLSSSRQQLLKPHLQRILAQKNFSKDVYEIVNKIIA